LLTDFAVDTHFSLEGTDSEHHDSTKDRQACVENFQRDDGPPVFLI
jgi:SNF2 family DNA or RNA helicase